MRKQVISNSSGHNPTSRTDNHGIPWFYPSRARDLAFGSQEDVDVSSPVVGRFVENQEPALRGGEASSPGVYR